MASLSLLPLHHDSAFMVNDGNAEGSHVAPTIAGRSEGRARYLLADKGYDANSLRKHLHQSAIVPVNPSQSNRKCPIHYDIKL